MTERMSPEVLALGRMKAGQMNKLEASFARALADDTAVVWFGFEPVTLRLSDGSRYTPDFMAEHRAFDRLRAYEVKGRSTWTEDGRRKFEAAVREFPWLSFRVVTRPSRGADARFWYEVHS